MDNNKGIIGVSENASTDARNATAYMYTNLTMKHNHVNSEQFA